MLLSHARRNCVECFGCSSAHVAVKARACLRNEEISRSHYLDATGAQSVLCLYSHYLIFCIPSLFCYHRYTRLPRSHSVPNVCPCKNCAFRRPLIVRNCGESGTIPDDSFLLLGSRSLISQQLLSYCICFVVLMCWFLPGRGVANDDATRVGRPRGLL